MKLIILLLAILPFAGAVQAVTENFEDDTAGANPSGSWYSFYETASAMDGTVSSSGCFEGTKCLQLTRSTDFFASAGFNMQTGGLDLCRSGASVTYWFKGTTGGSSSWVVWSGINSASSPGQGVGHFWGQISDGFTVASANADSDTDTVAGPSPAKFDGAWHKVVQTFDCPGNSVSVNIDNGAFTFTHSDSGTDITNGSVLFTGAWKNTASGNIVWFIDNITVTGADPILPEITTFTSQYTSVRNGTTAHLTWTTINATSCTASGAWNGTVPTQGTLYEATITGNGPTNLVLTCVSSEGGITNATISINVIEQLQIAGPNGLIFGGDRAALAEAAHVSETALSFLFGVLFMFIFGLIGMAAAGLNGGLGGALAGLIISLAIGILPVWFLFLIAAAFLLLLYSMRRGASNGL